MKKGFTLIELLGAIFLIGVFALITYYVVGDLIETSASKVYIKTESLLVENARNYALSSDFVFPDVIGEYVIIEGSTLEQEGVISRISDPKDNSSTCLGKIYVYKSTETVYEYIPFLDCGSNYRSILPAYLDN